MVIPYYRTEAHKYGFLKITYICPLCKKLHLIEVSERQWQELNDNKHPKAVTDILYNLTKIEQEIAITGKCKNCLSK